MEILEWYGVWVVLVCAGLLLFATEVMLNGWSRWMKALTLVAIAVVLGYFFIVVILSYFLAGLFL